MGCLSPAATFYRLVHGFLLSLCSSSIKRMETGQAAMHGRLEVSIQFDRKRRLGDMQGSLAEEQEGGGRFNNQNRPGTQPGLLTPDKRLKLGRTADDSDRRCLLENDNRLRHKKYPLAQSHHSRRGRSHHLLPK
jgi:hypothetical protein